MQFTMGGIHMFAIVRPEMSYGHIKDMQDNTSVGQSNNNRTSIDVEVIHLDPDEKRIFKCE